MVTDAGTEFKQPFATHLDELGISHHVTDSHSPWQNGRTERRGGFVKKLLEKAKLETVVTEYSELLLLINESVLAHNRFFNRSGYSPQQRVFGYSHRVPRTLTSDDPIDAESLAMDIGGRSDAQRAHEIRMAGRPRKRSSKLTRSSRWLAHYTAELVHESR